MVAGCRDKIAGAVRGISMLIRCCSLQHTHRKKRHGRWASCLPRNAMCLCSRSPSPYSPCCAADPAAHTSLQAGISDQLCHEHAPTRHLPPACITFLPARFPSKQPQHSNQPVSPPPLLPAACLICLLKRAPNLAAPGSTQQRLRDNPHLRRIRQRCARRSGGTTALGWPLAASCARCPESTCRGERSRGGGGWGVGHQLGSTFKYPSRQTCVMEDEPGLQYSSFCNAWRELSLNRQAHMQGCWLGAVLGVLCWGALL